MKNLNIENDIFIVTKAKPVVSFRNKWWETEYDENCILTTLKIKDNSYPNGDCFDIFDCFIDIDSNEEFFKEISYIIEEYEFNIDNAEIIYNSRYQHRYIFNNDNQKYTEKRFFNNILEAMKYSALLNVKILKKQKKIFKKWWSEKDENVFIFWKNVLKRFDNL